LNIGKTIWPNIVLWITEVEEGYTSEGQQCITGKGRTNILMDPRWAKFVMDYITIGGNRAQVITLKGLPCGDLGIINIYAPFGEFC
jgi:hypothetical protein